MYEFCIVVTRRAPSLQAPGSILQGFGLYPPATTPLLKPILVMPSSFMHSAQILRDRALIRASG